MFCCFPSEGHCVITTVFVCQCPDARKSVRDMTARSLKASLNDDTVDVAAEHYFVAHIPQRSDHQNHYMGPVCVSLAVTLFFGCSVVLV